MASNQPLAKATPRRLDPQDCAILTDYKLGKVIGGQRIGWPCNHRTQFLNFRGNPGTSRSWVAVRISIPRDPEDPATYFFGTASAPRECHAVELRLWHGTFKFGVCEMPPEPKALLPSIMNKGTVAERIIVIALELVDGQNAVLAGMETPTSTATQADSDALFAGGTFDGVKPLLELARQREFRIIIPNKEPATHHNKWLLADMHPDNTAPMKFLHLTARYVSSCMCFGLLLTCE